MADTGSGLVQEQGWRPQGRDGIGPASTVAVGDTDKQRLGGMHQQDGQADERRGAAVLPGEGVVSESSGTRLSLAEFEEFQGSGGADEGRTTSEFHRALFPPGPADRDAWREIIEDRPDLAPAIEYEIRGMASRIAGGIDFARPDQLRSLGNLVVPMQAALALLILLDRTE